VSPVVIDGRTIAKTFWGKAWCKNLERYSDFSNRLPRGRTYVRNGSVLDLQVGAGSVKALVNGSMMYKVSVKVASVPKARWRAICKDSAGAIDSLVELLQGHFSKGVMERICRQGTGLFPAPSEIRFSCSCPDWAAMCKHVAAVFYGIGARFDERPELLFKLREVDEKDLIAKAGRGLPIAKKGPAAEKVLAAGDLSELFGLDLVGGNPEPVEGSALVKRTKRTRAKQASAKRAMATPIAEGSGRRPPAARKKTSSRQSSRAIQKKSKPVTKLVGKKRGARKR
jgi:uncharacterized Zn finger protein